MSAAAALLLDMTLKAGLLCLIGLGLAALARRRSAALRHDVWLAVIACCALLPLAAAAFRIAGPALPVAPVHEAVMAAAPALPAGVPAGAIEAVDRIWSGDGAVSQSGRVETGLVALWLIGLALAGLRMLLAYRGAGAIVRRASPFAGAAAPRGVRLLVTAELTAPALFGLRAPAILFPAEAAGWSAERLRAVLAHETAHVERRDCALELLAQSACALNWYNPLVWRAARAMRAERELACDERVVAAGLDARSYAVALVQVARSALGAPQRALLAMARPPELERRVVLLLGPRRWVAGNGRARRSLAWAAVALVMPFAMLTTPAAGVLASGSVQPGDGPLSGLDDPMSERVPFDYDRLAAVAGAIPPVGPEQRAIGSLQAHLERVPRGYGDLVRERAIWALAQIEGGRLFEPLAAHVADRDWRVRAYAAWGWQRPATGARPPC